MRPPGGPARGWPAGAPPGDRGRRSCRTARAPGRAPRGRAAAAAPDRRSAGRSPRPAPADPSGGTSRPLTPSSISSGTAREPARDRGQLHGARLEQHVRQAVAIAVGRDPAREHEQIRAPVGLQHLVLRQRRRASAPARASPSAAARASRSVAQRAAADVGVAPVQRRRQRRERRSSTSRPFFGTSRATPRSWTGRAGSLPSGPGPPARRREALGVQAVIGQHDLGGRRQRPQMGGVGGAARRSTSGSPRASRTSPTRAWSRRPWRAPKRTSRGL